MLKMETSNILLLRLLLYIKMGTNMWTPHRFPLTMMDFSTLLIKIARDVYSIELTLNGTRNKKIRK